MNSWESAFWLTCLLAFVQIAHDRSRTLCWTGSGMAAGLGLLNKPSMAFFLIALGVGLLLTPQRRLLFTRQAAWGISLLLVIALPNLLWQVQHGWPTLEFLHNGRVEHKNTHLSPLAFLANQIFTLGPWTAFVWIPGLVRALRKPDLRWIGYTFLLFLAVMIGMGAKDYYATPIYPVLHAIGGIAWERRFAGSKRVQQDCVIAFPVSFAMALILCALVLPLAQPVLRPATFLAYGRALHLPSTNSENTSSGLLPQFYADRFGWQEEVDQVQHVVAELSPEERSRAAIVCDNYGEAGALEFLGHDLPPVLSGHNTYWLWGTHGASGQVLILIERNAPEHYRSLFDSVQVVGHMDAPWAMPYERGKTIYLVRGPKFGSLDSIWLKQKHYI